jgi:leucyl aminopeptidase
MTIEVNNTDAEGRLTLADALWYAQVMGGWTWLMPYGSLRW